MIGALLPLESQALRGRKGGHSELHNMSSPCKAVDKRSVQYWIYNTSPNTARKRS